jgi:hypothetical protein
MLPKESVNEIYTRLNIFVEDLNALRLTQMSQSDVARRILSVLPIEKYGHIITVLQQSDLSTTIPTQVLGKINAHEMYIHITPKRAHHLPRRRTWPSKLAMARKRRRAKP